MEQMIGITPTPVEQEKLIGTKWSNWCELHHSQVSVEFVDKTNCIYMLKPRKFSETYIVTEGKLYISNIEGPFELRDNVLYNNDLPIFEKTA